VIGRRWVLLPLIAALLGAYGYRAASGIRGGWAFDRGHLLRNKGDYTESVARLDGAAVGANTVRALVMAGEVRIDEWEAEVRRRGALGADPTVLVAAAADFLACRCAAPTERRAWKGLGEVYDAIEWIGRERRAETPYVSAVDPWVRIGRPGRIALGMLRATLEVSPNWGHLYDRLALTLWNYGLDDAAREAVRQSARVLPIFYRHPYHKIPELPDWVDREFAVASREVLGEVPFFPRSGHLVDLGQLERRIGATDRAIEAFQEALAAGDHKLKRAEASFHLGLALADRGRHEEARVHLNASREHPVFRISALRGLVNSAEALGEYDVALGYLRRLRWEQPSELWPCLKFADLAERTGDWPAALESLRWAKLKHPEDPRPYIALVEAHLAMGDSPAATTVVAELAEVVGADRAEVADLRRKIDSASGRPRPSVTPD
jgi:tetratricopeptide (TPR) repeat protein